jgi:hypothetical protein
MDNHQGANKVLRTCKFFTNQTTVRNESTLTVTKSRRESPKLSTSYKRMFFFYEKNRLLCGMNFGDHLFAVRAGQNVKEVFSLTVVGRVPRKSMKQRCIYLCFQSSLT